MGVEDLKSPVSTFVSCGEVQSLETSEALLSTDSYSRPKSTTRRSHSRVRGLPRRSSQLKGSCQAYPRNKRRPKASDKILDKEAICPRCLFPGDRGNGNNHFENIAKSLAEMDGRYEKLFSMLSRICDRVEEGPEAHHIQPSPNRFQPRLDILNSLSFQKYHQMTLYPDPSRLCDMFLARYNLPHILSGSYDPIELLHMHGWEPEGYGDVLLVVGDTKSSVNISTHDKNPPGTDGAVPWKHVDQTREPHLAHQLARVAALVKEHWLYQGRSVRDPDEADVPFESDEFADSVLFLKCPGSTKTLLYQSSYDSAGAHFAREPWLSGKRSLLRQLQVAKPSQRKVFHDRGLLSFACIYLVLSQLCVVGDASQRILGTKKAIRFLGCYASKWPRFMPTSEVWLSSGWTHLHFHLRVLSAGKQYLPKAYHHHHQEQHQEPLVNGLRPSRVSGKLASLNGADDIGIVEQRFSVAVVASHTADTPLYTVLYLSDSGYRRLFMESERPLDMPSRGRLTGVAVYLRVLRSVLPIWERKWIETLNEVDNLVGIDDLFNPQSDGAATMFDSPVVESKFLNPIPEQTLRIFAEWIQESERELQRLRRDFDASFQFEASRRGSIDSGSSYASSATFAKEVDGAWDEVLDVHGSASKALLDRIEKKNEEIKSFRDGSLFSMGMFSYDDTWREQSAFLVSTVLIAFATWAVSAVVLWLVQDDARLSRIKLLLGCFRWKAAYPPRRSGFKEAGSEPVFQGV
ncbi:hypothetical protein AAE478_006764 [Parahypoxylon ruwenzoriense]